MSIVLFDLESAEKAAKYPQHVGLEIAKGLNCCGFHSSVLSGLRTPFDKREELGC
jgi:hypothetical protein